MTVRRRSCFALLGVVLALGGLLLMHGLDAPGSGLTYGSHAGVEVVHGAGVDDDDCKESCPHAAHFIAMCVAVLAVVAATVLTVGGRQRIDLSLPPWPSGRRPLCRVLVPRPPRPAWLRLSVIRC